MTHLLDIDQLRTAAGAPLDTFDRYESIYFLGTHTQTFRLRGIVMAQALPHFAGALVFEDNQDKRTRLAQMLNQQQPWELVTTGDLLARSAADKARVLVIDFNENLAGKQIARVLSEAGVRVWDCLHAMHQLDMRHTYTSMREERAYAVDHFDQIAQQAGLLTDATSRRTLLARLQALITLDRAPLIEVAFPLADFINNFAPTAGIVVRANETFVDAGAAHGDTVNHFYQTTLGDYRAIHAFEPDANSYGALSVLCGFLPRTSVYFAGLGERAGSLEFFEDPDNRFGSNFLTRPASNDGSTKQMRMMAIDDVIDPATEDAILIKIDVEGFEAAVIRGAARTIASCRPNMTISAYHYPHDIGEIIATVLAIHPYRHVGLRHYSASLYDTQLMFSDDQSF